jgi:hypothetical protein
VSQLSTPPFQPNARSAAQSAEDDKMLRLEEYKLFIDDTARFTERRQTITNTYISINSAIAGLLAFLVKDSGLTGWLVPVAIVALVGSGLVICSYWAQLIYKYKTLVGFRIRLLREMEDRIPGLTRIYHREDELYPVDEHGHSIPGQGLNISDLEVRLPMLFRRLYIALAAILVAGFLWNAFSAPSTSNVSGTPAITATPAAASPSP